MRVDHQTIKFPEPTMDAIIGSHKAAGSIITEGVGVVIGTLDDNQNKTEISNQLINKLFDNIIYDHPWHMGATVRNSPLRYMQH